MRGRSIIKDYDIEVNKLNRPLSIAQVLPDPLVVNNMLHGASWPIRFDAITEFIRRAHTMMVVEANQSPLIRMRLVSYLIILFDIPTNSPYYIPSNIVLTRIMSQTNRYYFFQDNEFIYNILKSIYDRR